MATRRLQIIFAANTRGAMASIKGLGQGVSGLDSQLARLARRSRDLQGLGSAMVGAGLAIKGALTMATIEAAKFNQEMADVSTLVDESKVSIEAYKKSVLGLPSVLGNATGLAKGLYETLSADIPADKAIKFTADSAKLAKAGRATVAQSVDILSTIVNAYGMQAEDATRISDILFKTVEKGKTVIPELATSMGRVIPIAAQLGLSLEELSAAIATTTRGGLQTSESVTAIKSVLSDVLKPSARAKIVSEQLGIEFGVASLKARGFAGFLQHIRERFQQLSDPADLARMKMELLGANLEKVRDKKGQVTKEGEKLVAMFQALEEGAPEEAMAALFDNVKGLNVVMGLTGQQADGFARDLEVMQNAGGSTEKAFQKQTNTLMSSWETMGNAFGKLMIRIGSMGDGPLTKFFQQLTSGIDAASKWIDENEQLAQQIFLAAGAVGTFLVVGGTLLTMLGGIAAALAMVARGWKGFAPAAAVTGAKKVRGGQFFTNALEGGTVRNFSTLPAAASMGAALPGVAGLGAALGSGPVATLLQPQNALGIAATAGALPQLGKGLGLILAPLGQLLTRLPLLGPLFASLGGSTAAAGAAAVASGGLFGRFAAALPLVGRGLLALVGGPIGAVILGITALGVAWSRNLGGIRDTATRWMAQMKPVLVGGWQRLVQWVTETWEELSYNARFWFYRVLEEIKPALREVQSFFEEIGPDVKRIWDASLAVLVPIAKFQMENLIETFRTAWATTRLVFALAWDLIKGVIVTAWNVITPLVKGQLALISGIITAAMRLMKGDWFGAWDALEKGVTKALDGVWQAVTGGVTAVLDTLRNFGADLRDLGGELMQSLLDGVMSQGERSVEMAREIGEGMARGLEEGFAPRPNVLGQKMMGALQTGKEALPGIFQGLASHLEQLGALTGLDPKSVRQFARDSATGDRVMQLNQELLRRAGPALAMAKAQGHAPVITQGLRTHAEQAALFNSLPAGEAAAPGPGAPHMSGFAMDVVSENMEATAALLRQAGLKATIHKGTGWHIHVEYPISAGAVPSAGGGTPNTSAVPGVDENATKKALRERENALKWLEDLRTDAQTDILALADKQFDADRLKAKREAEARRRELKEAALNEQERAEAIRLINENLAAELRDIDKRQAEHKKKQDEEALQQAKRAGEELAKAFADAEPLDLTAGIDAATTKVQGIVEAERSRLESLRQMVDESRKRIFEQQGNQRAAALLTLEQELAQVRQAWKVHEQAQEQMELEHQARLDSIERERVFARVDYARETSTAINSLRGAALAERLFQIQQEYQAKTAALELEYQGEVANETRIMEAKLLLRQQWEVIEQDFRTRRQEAERLASSTTQQLWMGALEQIKASFQQNLAQMLSGQLSFGDFLKNMFQQILSAFANMVAQMVVKWFEGLADMKKGAGGLGGGFGGGLGGTLLGVVGGILGFHDGGLVPGTGRGDKVPALLEPGEFVLPRDVVDQARRFGARPMLRMQRGGMVPAVAGAGAGGGGVRVEFHHHGDVRSEADVQSIRRSVEEAISEAMRRGGYR